MTKLEEALEETFMPKLASICTPLIEQTMLEIKEAHKTVKPLMSKSELTKWLGVGTATIDNWVAQGMPIVDIKGEAYPRFLVKHVLEFLEQKSQ